MSETAPLISVIVPVYGVEKYLDRCLDSIVNQTYRNLQIILVDDKSPDSSPEICDKWEQTDSRISVIHKDVNEGLGMARNTGMTIANGDYIAFVDSDDYLDKDAYRRLVENAAETGADIVYMSCKRELPDHSFVDVPIENEVRCDNMPEYAVKFVPGCTGSAYMCSVWAAIFSKSVAKESFISERIAISEDLNWTLRTVLRSSVISRIQYYGYYYMYNDASITKTYKGSDFKRIVESAKVIDKIFSPLGMNDIAPTYLLEVTRTMLRNVVFGHKLSAKKQRNAIRSLLKESGYLDFLKGRKFMNFGVKDRLFLTMQKTGSTSLNHIWGWIDYHIIVHKFRNLFKS